MDEFENSFVGGVHISRYVASWTKCGYPVNSLFKAWLKSLDLNDEQVNRIWYFATNGRLELQSSARHFMRSKGFD